jgi:hypothetical protein
MESRLLSTTDLLTLRRKPRAIALMRHESTLINRHSPLWFGVRSLVTNSGRYTTGIVREAGVSAVLQAVGRDTRPERALVAFASYGDAHRYPSDHDLWFRLLEAHVVHSVHHHIQRLYATVPSHLSDTFEIFRQNGYSSFSKELLLRLDGPDWDQGTRIAPMTPQHRHDVWGVHQLYGQTTPKPVQHAEAKAARDWMLPLPKPWDTVKHRAWVQRHHEQVVASLRIASGRDAHIIHLMVQPSLRDDVTHLLRFGISQVADTLPIWLVLREYQEDLVWSAQDLGFQPIDEQMSLVRHNVALIRRPAFASVLEPKRDQGTPVPTIIPASEQARLYARTKRHHQ